MTDNIRTAFTEFFSAHPIRRTHYQCDAFFIDYLSTFIDYRYDITKMNNQIIIGNINKAQLVITARYDTDRLLLFKHKRYYHRQEIVKYYRIDQYLRISLLILGCALILLLPFENHLKVISIGLIFYLLIIGIANRYTFSLTLPLFLLKQLVPIVKDKKVAFVLYAKKLDDDIISDKQKVINLERCGAGNCIAVCASDVILLDDDLDLLDRYADQHQLIINVGFFDSQGFYQVHIDSNSDSSLNLAIYHKLLTILKHFIDKLSYN